jgi:hypothetical protein
VCASFGKLANVISMCLEKHKLPKLHLVTKVKIYTGQNLNMISLLNQKINVKVTFVHCKQKYFAFTIM